MKKNEFRKIGYKERYECFIQKKKTFFIFLMFSILFFLADVITFLVIVSYENINKVYFINLPIFILITLFLTYVVIGLISINKEIKFLSSLFSKYLNIIEGKITNISKTSIALKNRTVTEISVLEGKDTYLLYLDNCYEVNPFNVDDKVTLKVADNFILEYEIYESKSSK